MGYLTLLSVLAFAGNSLLCRAALLHTRIDPASFTTLRLLAGALTLLLLARMQRTRSAGSGNWLSALALFVYAAGFSFAYVSVSAATGALLLFAAVQACMIGFGLLTGERLQGRQWVGLGLALGGVLLLLIPGLTRPSLSGALLMLCAGVAWGVYTLRGRGPGDPIRVNAGNFLRAAVLACVLSVVLLNDVTLDGLGVGYALVSGAVTSAIGYAIWYRVLPHLRAITAANVQLSVPVIAALGGVVLLGEATSLRLLLSALAVLGGIAMVIAGKRAAPPELPTA
ncbi:MAG: DMT family transporter [Pseudomarimonas sp.]